MGIRIHKFLGYGLTDLAHEGTKLTDPRVNLASPALSYELPAIREYAKWLREENLANGTKGDLDTWFIREQAKKKKKLNLDGCFVYSPEFGLANVLAIRPVCMHTWSRSDDSIDYAQETYLSDELTGDVTRDRAEEIHHGLYPWNGSYMDTRTGAALDDKILWWIRAKNSKSLRDQKDLDVLAVAAGFKDHAQALKYVAPEVPTEVRNLTEFANLFTSEHVWRELRPLLYTYWG
jgi:hypothetical protein